MTRYPSGNSGVRKVSLLLAVIMMLSITVGAGEDYGGSDGYSPAYEESAESEPSAEPPDEPASDDYPGEYIPNEDPQKDDDPSGGDNPYNNPSVGDPSDENPLDDNENNNDDSDPLDPFEPDCGDDCDCDLSDAFGAFIGFEPMMFLPSIVDTAGDFTQFIEKVFLAERVDGEHVELSDAEPYLMHTNGAVYLVLSLFDLGRFDLTRLGEASPAALEFNFQLPYGLVKHHSASNDALLTLNDGSVLGCLTFTSATQGAFVFTTHPDEFDLFQGGVPSIENIWMYVRCGIDPEYITDTGVRSLDINLGPFDHSKDYTLTFSDRAPPIPEMFKSGRYNSGTGLYDWTVTILAPPGDERDWLSNISFTDLTCPNHRLVGQVTANGSRAVMNDSPISFTSTFGALNSVLTSDSANILPELLARTESALGWVSDGSFELYLHGSYTGTMTIKYSTTLTPDALSKMAGGNVTLSNSSESIWAGRTDPLRANARVSLSNTSFVSKDGIFVPGQNVVRWTITVDTFGQRFETLTLHDALRGDMLHHTNVQVNKVNVDSYTSSNYMLNSGTSPSDVKDDPNPDAPGYYIAVDFIGLVSSGAIPRASVYVVTYDTPVPGDFFGPDGFYGDASKDIENDAWLEWKWYPWTGTGPGTWNWIPPDLSKQAPASTPVLKRAVSYNPATTLITWEITVNPNWLNLTNIVVVDTVAPSDSGLNLFTHESLTYVPGSLRISGSPLVTCMALHVTTPPSIDLDGNRGTFSLPDLNGVQAVFRVTTQVTDRDFLLSNIRNPASGSGVGAVHEFTFRNIVSMTALASGSGTSVSGIDTADIHPANNIISKTAGAYDYATREMSWTIVANADRVRGLGYSYIEDTMSSNQSLVSGSVFMNGTPASVTTSALVNTKDTFSQDGQRLTFFLGDISGPDNGVGDMVIITYKTKINYGPGDGEALPFQETLAVSNSALFYAYGDVQSAEVDASRQIPFTVADKRNTGVAIPGGNLSTRLVSYRVLFNNEKNDISTAFQFVDTLTTRDGLMMDFDITSVKLYRATILPNGQFQFDRATDDLGLSTTSAVSVTGNVMTVTVTPSSLGLTSVQALVLEYDVVMRRTDGRPIEGAAENKVEVIGVNNQNYAPNGGVNRAQLDSASGSGGNLGRFHRINIVKYDEKRASDSALNATEWVRGARFEIYRYTGIFPLQPTFPSGDPLDMEMTKVGEGITNIRGELSFELLLPGSINSYYVREVGPPLGYLGESRLLPTNSPIDAGAYIQVQPLPTDNRTHDLNLQNIRRTTDIEFYKVGYDYHFKTGSPGSFKALSGASFELTDIDGFVATRTTATAVDGRVVFDNVPWGVYTLREITPATDHVLHNGTYTLTVERDGAYMITPNAGGTWPTWRGLYGVPANVTRAPLSLATSMAIVFPFVADGKNFQGIINEMGTVKVWNTDGVDGPRITPGAFNLTPAAFRIERIDDPGWYWEGTIDNTCIDGRLLIPGLVYDASYRITELSPPFGFSPALMPDGFGGTTSWSAIITVGALAAGADYDYDGPIHFNIPVPSPRAPKYRIEFTNHVQVYDYENNARITTTAVGTDRSLFTLHYRNLDGTLGAPVPGHVGVAPDANGIVSFAGIAFNNYFIVQTHSPDGYALPQRAGSVAAQNADMSVELTRSGNAAEPIVKITVLNPSANSSGRPNQQAVIVDTAYSVNRAFVNEKGSLRVTKRDNLYSNAPASYFAGTVFEARHVTTGAIEPVRRATAGAFGAPSDVALFIGLTTGEQYDIYEITPPPGYAPHSSSPAAFASFSPLATLTATGRKNVSTVDGATIVYNDRATAHAFTFIKRGVTPYSVGVTDTALLAGVPFTLSISNANISTAAAVAAGFTLSGTSLVMTTVSALDGTVSFPNLPFGTYTLTQTAAAALDDGNYRFDNRPVTFTIATNGAVTITSAPTSNPVVWAGAPGSFTHTSYLGQFTAGKRDAASVNLASMGGIEFRLYVSASPLVLVATETTSSPGGVAVFNNLLLNTTYLLEEIVPAGYIAPAEHHSFVLTDTGYANTTGYMRSTTLYNARDPIYSFGFVKEDDHGNELEGAVFGLFTLAGVEIEGFNASGSPVAAGTPLRVSSDSFGLVRFTDIPFDIYRIKEISMPDIGDNSYDISDEILTVEINNTGAYTITSNKDGRFESAAANSNSALVVKNTLLGSITVTVRSTETGDPPLEGVSLQLYVNGVATGAAVMTDASGQVMFKRLPLGMAYTVVEVPNFLGGYNRIPYGNDGIISPASVTLAYATEHNVSRTVTKALSPISFGFNKVDFFSTSLAGATFGLYTSAAGVLTQTASAASLLPDGRVTFTGHLGSIYYIQEISAPDTYRASTSLIRAEVVLSDPGDKYSDAVTRFSVVSGTGAVITDGGLTATVTNNNTGRLTIHNLDALDNDVRVSGVSITLYSANADGVTTIAALETVITTAGGVAAFATELEIGGHYIAVVNGIEGGAYALGNPAPSVYIHVDPSPAGDVTQIHYVRTLEYARAPVFSFGFIKQDDVRGAALDGAVFGLFADDAATSASAVTGFNSSGGAIAALTSPGAQITAASDVLGLPPGGVRFENLPFGTYYIKELSPPPLDGVWSFAKSDAVLEAVIAPNGSYTLTLVSGQAADIGGVPADNVPRDTISGLIVKNQLLGSLVVTVTRKLDEIVNPGEPIPGVTLRLTGTDGTTRTAITTADGLVTFAGLTLGVGYTLEEIYPYVPFYDGISPSGFVVTPTALLYHLTETVTKAMLGNYHIVFDKVDSFGGAVEGAVFGLYTNAALTQPYMRNGVHFTAVSSPTGEAAFNYLRKGDYYIRELSAPAGYTKNDAVLKVVLSEVGLDLDVVATFSIASPSGIGMNVTIGDLTSGASIISDGAAAVTNNNTGTLVITNADALSSGAIFVSGVSVILRRDGVVVDTQVSGADGVVTFAGLTLNGTYTAEVTTIAGNGYTITSAHSVTVIVTGAGVTALAFTETFEYERAEIFSFGFWKEDNYGERLNGAVFGLFTTSAVFESIPILKATSGAFAAPGQEGRVWFANLAFGTYYIAELEPPYPIGLTTYKMSDVVLRVEIESDGRYTITRESGSPGDIRGAAVGVTSGILPIPSAHLAVKNELLGSIRIIVQDIFGNPLEGTELALLTETKSTNTSGIAIFTGLPLDALHITTIGAIPLGYLPYGNDIEITLTHPGDYHETYTVTLQREPVHSIELIKRNNTGGALPGAEFGILQTLDGTSFAALSGGALFTPTLTTVSALDGTVKFENLTFGRYFVRETLQPQNFIRADAVLMYDIAADGAVTATVVHNTTEPVLTGIGGGMIV
ncbi:MAG: SpaA isopeptide-forming pilin-related protein, partial [Defluviitaleaceae bacterium]|nr:SpaA isopeptide-forming pilin-related protein [Defluviitaleaceae bacterium]